MPIESLIDLIRRVPHTLLVLNNLTPEQALRLLQAPDLSLDNVFVDVAAMDKEFDGLAKVLGQCGSRHLVYGSQVPFLYPEAPLALIQENGFSDAEIEAILERNGLNHPVLARVIAGHTP